MREALATWRPVVDDAIADVFPREVTRASLSEFFGEPTYEYDVDGIQHAIADPVWDLLDRGGKRWRAVLFLKLVEGFGEPPEEYSQYAVVPELLHTGTILVDDVEDEARKRRGDPAIQHLYGDDVALNAGNALYFLSLKVLANDAGDLDDGTRLRAYEMLVSELNRTHLGQGLDIHWHNEREVRPSEVQYLEMCACKTGCLGRIVAQLAAIVTGQDETTANQVADFAEYASIAFQVGDDILDVEASLADESEFGKAFGNDVREGKMTLLVLHALREADAGTARRLADVLASDETTDADVEFALDVFVETDAVAHARDVALDLAATARAKLDDVALDPDVEAELDEFTRFVVDRDQ